MSDDLDRAQGLEELEREQSLAHQAQAAAQHETPFEIEGRRVCLECFEPLAKKRLKANPQAVRCVECQELHEKRQRGYRA